MVFSVYTSVVVDVAKAVRTITLSKSETITESQIPWAPLSDNKFVCNNCQISLALMIPGTNSQGHQGILPVLFRIYIVMLLQLK